jgi:hypothetical protein
MKTSSEVISGLDWHFDNVPDGELVAVRKDPWLSTLNPQPSPANGRAADFLSASNGEGN